MAAITLIVASRALILTYKTKYIFIVIAMNPAIYSTINSTDRLWYYSCVPAIKKIFDNIK